MSTTLPHTDERGCTLGMDSSTLHGWWCVTHNVNVDHDGRTYDPNAEPTCGDEWCMAGTSAVNPDAAE